MVEIMRIAKKYRLYVIEDCAELWATINQTAVGTFGDVSAISLRTK